MTIPSQAQPPEYEFVPVEAEEKAEVVVPAEAKELEELEYPLVLEHEISVGTPPAESKRDFPVQKVASPKVSIPIAPPSVSREAIRAAARDFGSVLKVTTLEMRGEIDKALLVTTSTIAKYKLAVQNFFSRSTRQQELTKMKGMREQTKAATLKFLKFRRELIKMEEGLKNFKGNPAAQKKAIDNYCQLKQDNETQLQRIENWKVYFKAREALLSGEQVSPNLEDSFVGNVKTSVAEQIAREKATLYQELLKPQEKMAPRPPSLIRYANLPRIRPPQVQLNPPENPATPKALEVAFKIIITPPELRAQEAKAEKGEEVLKTPEKGYENARQRRKEAESKLFENDAVKRQFKRFGELNDNTISDKRRIGLLNEYIKAIDGFKDYVSDRADKAADKAGAHTDFWKNLKGQLDDFSGLVQKELRAERKFLKR